MASRSCPLKSHVAPAMIYTSKMDVLGSILRKRISNHLRPDRVPLIGKSKSQWDFYCKDAWQVFYFLLIGLDHNYPKQCA